METSLVGTLFNERYRIDAILGKGGAGVVYAAHDMLLDRDVAVKMLTESSLGSQGRARLLHEAKAAARLNHPNIVSIYDAGESQHTAFIVMELLRGDSLFEQRFQSIEAILIVARQICQALEHAHTHGIVHRDLKPENVIMAPDGTIKLTDFGLARSVASRVSLEGTIVGTVFYLPPEQALGQPVDGRADLYSLGVMLYEMLTGRLPFAADEPLAVITQHLYTPPIPPSTYNADIPPLLETLILKLMSKHSDERPASARQVEQVLDMLAGAPPGSETPNRQSQRALAVDLVSSDLLGGGGHSISPLDLLVRGRLVGREREFAEGRALWKRAASAAGDQRVLFISGEAGVGKTPLVREIIALAEVSGGSAMTGECYAEGSAPYAPVAQIVRTALSLLETSAAGNGEERGAASGAAALALPELVLADLITIAPDLRTRYPAVPPNPPLEPSAEQQRLFESLVTLFTDLSERQPALVALEDVQWADCGTLLLLRHLARRGRANGLRLLIVMTYREVELSAEHALNGILLDLNREHLSARIKLARFDRQQTRQLLLTMFQQEPSDEFLESIYLETEGSQFFIEEVCKALVDDGKISRQDGRWQWPADMHALRLPQNVRLAIQERLSKLPPQALEVLQMAAIIGREFDFETLKYASDLDEEALIQALESAEQAQLIHEARRPGEEAFVFAHGLTISALKESISSLRRRRLHRRVAEAIQELCCQDYEILAYHYAQAGDREMARQYTIQAAERARQMYAHEQAIRAYNEALALSAEEDLPERFPLLAGRASMLRLTGRYEEEYADVQSMQTIAEKLDDDGLRCDALIALADHYMVTEIMLARQPAEQAAELARALGDPLRQGRALLCLGSNAVHRYDFLTSLNLLQSAAARFQEADLPGEAAACLNMLSMTLGNLGQPQSALQTAQDAHQLSRLAGDRLREASSLRRVAIAYMRLRDYPKALPVSQEALALHKKLGDRSEECNALNVNGIILGWLGRYEESEDNMRQSLELAHQIGSGAGIANAVENLLWMHYERRGDLEASLAFVQAELQQAQPENDIFLTAMLQARQAEILAAFGQYKQARQVFQSVLEMSETWLSTAVQATALSFLGQICTEMKDYKNARQYLLAAQERSTQGCPAADRGLVLSRLAYFKMLKGGKRNLLTGLGYARQAAEILSSGEASTRLANAWAVSAYLYLELGGAQPALECSRQAIALAETWPFTRVEYSLVHALALRAAGNQAESDDYLRRAYQRVTLVAQRTQDETLRHSWLNHVRANKLTLTEWQEWLEEKDNG